MNTNLNTNPKAVLITGASGRIGFELAEQCIELGYHVILHYRSSPQPAQSFFKDDSRVTFLQAELTESPEKFVEDVFKLPLTLEGLINSASVFQTGNMSDPNHFQSVMSVNVMVPLRLAAEFAKYVKNGWILNITDAHTKPKSKNYQNYRVSKMFLDEITRQLAFLYAPAIRVNAIAPGAILPAAGGSAGKFDVLAKNIPLGKTGNVGYIRQTFRFLVENDYITGCVIPVDGGWHLCG
ncbi:MAG: SDR family oxidoreductase [Chitinispirillales bacterium]|jgi:NAD(P)-dependent dehydrogenase (short-subunit alcohol dehydrogenase family)|nr:SDR family oxidoreductase [Chitinispirillales bacterium]